jgi:hypothetical protein
MADDRDGTVEVREVAAPAPTHVEVLAIQVGVRVERDVAVIGVLPDDDDAAGVARAAHRRDDGGRCAGRFEDDVGTAATTARPHPFDLLGSGRRREVEHGVDAERRCRREPRRRPADREHGCGARRPRECGERQPDRPGPEHEDDVADPDAGPFDAVDRRRQRAPGREERARRRRSEAQHTRVGFQVDVIGPPTAESVGGAVRDSVDLPLRTSRARLRDEAVPAAMTGAVHVEERHDVAFLQRHAGETSVMQMHVGAADLAERDLKQRFTCAEIRQRVFAEFDVAVRSGKDGGECGAHRVGDGSDAARWRRALRCAARDETMTTPTPTRSRSSRILRRVLIVVGGAAVVVVALWFLVVPPILDAQLQSALRGLGFVEARYTISAVRPGRVELSNVAIGAGEWLTARRIEATFTVGSLLAGRVVDVVVESPIWNLRDAPPERRLPPFDEWKPRPAADAEAPPGDAPAAFPFRRIVVREAHVLLPAASPIAAAEIDVTFDGEPGRRAPLTVRVGDGWRSARFTGTCGFDAGVGDRFLAVDVTARDGDVEVADVTFAGSARVRLVTPIGASATTDASVTVDVDASELRFGKIVGVDGLTAAVAWRGLTAPVTTDGQRVQWRALRIGDVGTLGGFATFAIRTGNIVDVEQARWNVDERGVMALDPFRFEPARSEVATTLRVYEVPLDDWLTMFSSGRVSGTGRLDGHVSTRVTWRPKLHVAFGGGRLEGTEEGGVIRFLDDAKTRALVETYVAKPAAAQAGAYSGLVEQRIVGSLQDFAFRKLEFDLVPRDGDLDLKIRIAGKGRTEPQELDLNLNLNGFDALVEVALDTYFMLDRLRRGVADTTEPAPTKR